MHPTASAGNVFPPSVRHCAANTGAAVRILGQLCQFVQSAAAESCQHATSQWLVSSCLISLCGKQHLELHTLHAPVYHTLCLTQSQALIYTLPCAALRTAQSFQKSSVHCPPCTLAALDGMACVISVMYQCCCGLFLRAKHSACTPTCGNVMALECKA